MEANSPEPADHRPDPHDGANGMWSHADVAARATLGPTPAGHLKGEEWPRHTTGSCNWANHLALGARPAPRVAERGPVRGMAFCCVFWRDTGLMVSPTRPTVGPERR